MSSRKWVSFVACLTPILLYLSACSDEEGKVGNGDWTGVCIDDDRDGYGLQCTSGPDCDDQDPLVHQGCAACSKPSEGCDCTPGAAPLACTDLPEVTGEGDLICKEGTRYCRDGIWSACEGIRSYTAPPPSQIKGIRQALSADAAVQCTGDCNRDCWIIQDPIDTPIGDAGAIYDIDSGISYTNNGGITVGGKGPEAGPPADELDPIPDCGVVDMDCDNIPDDLDPYPGDPPFKSEYKTLFFDIPAGASVNHTYNLQFFLRSADIYFLVDMTGSMSEEKANLISSLKSGNFLDDPTTGADESASITCADRNFDNMPDDELKDLGVAGNIACLIRSAGFGAGWFREVPFSATDSHSIKYAHPNFEAYEHRADISGDVTAVDNLSSTLEKFVTRGNQNWAESAAVALAALNGEQIYMGWDRPGIPARTCPAGHWGWPCFREDAMPVVVLITDAPIMNGPTPTSQTHLGDPGGSFPGNQPVNYDALGLRYMASTPDRTYHPVSGNESTTNNPHDVGVIDGIFKTFVGNTRGMAADMHSGNVPACSLFPATSATEPGHPDAVFKFTVNDSTKPLTISTRGTRHKPTLLIYPAGVTPQSVTLGASPTNTTAATAYDLGSLANPARGVTITGTTAPSAFTTGEITASMVSECLRGESPASTTPDAFFKFTVPQAMERVTFVADGTTAGFDAVLGLWEGAPPAAGPTTHALGTNDKIFQTASVLPTGTTASPGAINGRSVWLNAGSTNDSAINSDYSPALFDVTTSCGNVSGNARDAVIDFMVTGSTAKTIRFETTSATNLYGAPSWDNVLGLFQRPSSASGAMGNALTCNRRGAGTNRAYFERSLDPGTYSLVVRGEQGSDRGSYGVLISDATTRPVACHSEKTVQEFTVNLKPGVTYYLGLRSLTTSTGGGRGSYTIKIGGSYCAYDNAVYAQKTDAMGNITDVQYALGTAEIANQRFPAGEYYAVVKGNGHIVAASGDEGRGMYQITFGDPTLAINNETKTLPRWGTDGGVQQMLTDKGVRVLTVSSVKTCNGCTGGGTYANTALKEQADIISRNTGAIGETDTTRAFDIFNDGTGMGRAVVNAIATLTGNVAMDVTLRLKAYAPDIPARPFQFKARAIDVPGDTCDTPIDTNSDGVLDTHVDCAPGATPRFEFTITNPPAPNNVPVNPAPNTDGYAMKIEMIGDGKYVVDSSPVFIIPEDVVPDPPAFTFDASGTYAQDISATCTGTDRPSWQSLGWTDTLPADTSMVWRVCAGNTSSELTTCQTSGAWKTVATVTAGISCTSSTQCTDGYCAGGICHHPSSPANTCTTDLDCGGNGRCAASECKWSANPISLLPALKKGENGKAMVRAQVQLNANPARTAAPSVQDFSLRYVCTPGL